MIKIFTIGLLTFANLFFAQTITFDTFLKYNITENGERTILNLVVNSKETQNQYALRIDETGNSAHLLYLPNETIYDFSVENFNSKLNGTQIQLLNKHKNENLAKQFSKEEKNRNFEIEYIPNDNASLETHVKITEKGKFIKNKMASGVFKLEKNEGNLASYPLGFIFDMHTIANKLAWKYNSILISGSVKKGAGDLEINLIEKTPIKLSLEL